jgi:hypothetical protein
MVFALVAAGAIFGFVFSSGIISQAQNAFEIRKPVTLGLQWLGMISIALASIAGQLTTVTAILVLAGAGYLVWRSRAAILVGSFIGSILGALSGSSMGILGANYSAFSNRSALILGVAAVGIGVVFAPHRQVITPITAMTRRVRGAASALRVSDVKLNVSGVRAKAEAAKAALRNKAEAAAASAEASKAKVAAAKAEKATTEKVKTEKVKTEKVKARKAKAEKVEADEASDDSETLTSADDVILGRIRSIGDVEAEKTVKVETDETHVSPKESAKSDEEIIAELEKLLGE